MENKILQIKMSHSTVCIFETLHEEDKNNGDFLRSSGRWPCSVCRKGLVATLLSIQENAFISLNITLQDLFIPDIVSQEISVSFKCKFIQFDILYLKLFDM